MSRFLKMFCGVFIFGTVATSHMSARETHAQTHPGIPCFYAILTHGDIFWMNIPDLILMATLFICHSFIISLCRLSQPFRNISLVFLSGSQRHIFICIDFLPA
jgi:hypothetical protein